MYSEVLNRNGNLSFRLAERLKKQVDEMIQQLVGLNSQRLKDAYEGPPTMGVKNTLNVAEMKKATIEESYDGRILFPNITKAKEQTNV